MTGNDVERLVAAYQAAWLAHDVDAIMALVADDIVFHDLTAGVRVEGGEAFRAHVAATIDRLPDFSFVAHWVYLSADTGVAEWTVTATAPDGRRLEYDGVDVMNCRDGRITRNAVYSSAHAPRVLDA